ncbi:hypothetical protein EPUL_002863 [Erysiphe pulchra]|uniref:Reverse transcriptase domain-containing protein n=1 Tax=Erysiphe pulchra TaxID=225359 RepID=A0A2S4PV55_9PEZI|nr:hypothetical protein EPUL_002863 [Erysiphe pulchra]
MAGIVTIDVRGAFDDVLCNRLLFCSRTQDLSAQTQFDQIKPDPRGRFGYADDGCLLATAQTIEECGQKLSKLFDQTPQ